MNGLIRTFTKADDYVILRHGDMTITYKQDGIVSSMTIEHEGESIVVRSGPMETDKHGVKFRAQFIGPESFKVIPSHHIEHRTSGTERAGLNGRSLRERERTSAALQGKAS